MMARLISHFKSVINLTSVSLIDISSKSQSLAWQQTDHAMWNCDWCTQQSV